MSETERNEIAARAPRVCSLSCTCFTCATHDATTQRQTLGKWGREREREESKERERERERKERESERERGRERDSNSSWGPTLSVRAGVGFRAPCGSPCPPPRRFSSALPMASCMRSLSIPRAPSLTLLTSSSLDSRPPLSPIRPQQTRGLAAETLFPHTLAAKAGG